MKIALSVAVIACAASLIPAAHAATFTPGYSSVGTPNPAVYNFIGTGTDVVAQFVGSSAADRDVLEISVNGGPFTASTLNNRTSTRGATFDFGTVASGATIVFAILNQTTNTLLTSNAVLNADSDQHLWYFNYTAGTLGFSNINSGAALAFEDLLATQHSDFDYNDFEAVVTGVVDPPPDTPVGTTPLPAALPLFATGLGALGLLSWRRKRKARAVA